jgi:hypothetical protein
MAKAPVKMTINPKNRMIFFLFEAISLDLEFDCIIEWANLGG